MLPYEDLEYGGITERMGKLAEHDPLLLVKQKLSPPRTLGGCSKFQIGYYTPQARRE
jgi:hypothetical protein